MSNLKEIRGRIGSVKQTLKITSAMRLISSAKLHSAQNAISNMAAYEEALKGVFSGLSSCKGARKAVSGYLCFREGRTAVVLVTSNQSLCGGFNAALIKAFSKENFPLDSTVVYAIGKFGRKAAEKMGYETEDLSLMARKAEFNASSALAEKLTKAFLDGTYARVVMIYSHFASTSSLPVKVENFLPVASARTQDAVKDDGIDNYIVEPSAEELMALMLPKVLELGFHTMLLDAQAAEHAARTIAMQMASENGETLLSELSLQYNKLRQQAITNEILDLVGGQADNIQ